MFSQLHQGSQVWILDKSGKRPELKVGQVTNTPQVAPKYNTQNPAMTGFQPEMVVDLIVATDGRQYDLKQLHAGLQIEARDDIKAVISDSQESMLQEIEAMSVQSQQVLDSEAYHRDVLESCEQWRRMLNPRYEKEQRRDEQIDALTKRFDAFENKVGKALDKILQSKE